MASLSHYSLLTYTICLSFEDLKKTIDTKEYMDYIPDAWAGLIKVTKCYISEKQVSWLIFCGATT